MMRFVLSLDRPTTNLRHSHHGSDTIFSTCAVYHRHNSGRRPMINNNNNMSSFERLHFCCGDFSISVMVILEVIYAYRENSIF